MFDFLGRKVEGCLDAKVSQTLGKFNGGLLATDLVFLQGGVPHGIPQTSKASALSRRLRRYFSLAGPVNAHVKSHGAIGADGPSSLGELLGSR